MSDWCWTHTLLKRPNIGFARKPKRLNLLSDLGDNLALISDTSMPRLTDLFTRLGHTSASVKIKALGEIRSNARVEIKMKSKG
tara:strand:- start:36 stop:284 length:249 start_codon:yes stop_codon:yes gene_type:complete